MRLVLTLLLVEAFSLGALGFYDSSGSVINLDPASFDKRVKLDGAVWLVEFYAPWHVPFLRSILNYIFSNVTSDQA